MRLLPFAMQAAASPMWEPCTTHSPMPLNSRSRATMPLRSSIVPAMPTRTWPVPLPTSVTMPMSWVSVAQATKMQPFCPPFRTFNTQAARNITNFLYLCTRCQTIIAIMNKRSFPKITVTVQAEPWAEGHVARFITTRSVPQTPRVHRVITSSILPR